MFNAAPCGTGNRLIRYSPVRLAAVDVVAAQDACGAYPGVGADDRPGAAAGARPGGLLQPEGFLVAEAGALAE
jgi:hypothetical protein